MSLYWPEGRIALEVIPDPEPAADPGYGPDDLVLYVAENQVDSDEFVDFLRDVITMRIDDEDLRREEEDAVAEDRKTADERLDEKLRKRRGAYEDLYGPYAYGGDWLASSLGLAGAVPGGGQGLDLDADGAHITIESCGKVVVGR